MFLSAATSIPNKLLSEIILLSTGTSVDDKFSVAQVSQRWRAIALSSPLIWTAFRLETSMDWFRLPTVIARSGPNTLLDLELDPSFDCIACMATLAPHAPRFRFLHVDVSRNNRCLSPLFDDDIDFPALQTLRVISGDVSLNTRLTPTLRILHLENIRPTCPDPMDIQGPHIEELVLIACPNVTASGLLLILESCPKLSKLVFHSYDRLDRALPGAEPVPPHLLSPSVRSLDLSLTLTQIVAVLRKGFSEAVLPDISVRVDDDGGSSPGGMVQLWDALLRGMDPIISFEACEGMRIIVRDCVGRVRSLVVSDASAYWPVDAVWRHLFTTHSIGNTIVNLTIQAESFKDFSMGMVQCPLRGTRGGVGLKIVIKRDGGIDWGDRAPEIDIPGLEYVQLDNQRGSPLSSAEVLNILRPLRHTVGCSIKFAVQGVASDLFGVELDGILQDMQRDISERVAQE